jgi:hypothetical protein
MLFGMQCLKDIDHSPGLPERQSAATSTDSERRRRRAPWNCRYRHARIPRYLVEFIVASNPIFASRHIAGFNALTIS